MYYYVLHCDFCNSPSSLELPPSLPPFFLPSALSLSLPPSLGSSLSFYYSLEEFNLDDHDIDANTTGLMNDCSSKTHTHNLSMTLDTHSLLGMYTHIFMYYTLYIYIYRHVLYIHCTYIDMYTIHSSMICLTH